MNLFSKKRNKYYKNRSRITFKGNSKKFPRKVDYTSVIILFFIIILVFFYYVFFLSRYFRVQLIEINQTKIISNTELKDFIFKNISNNKYDIFPNNNIFFIKKENLEKTVSENFSEIEVVIIKKKYPDKLQIEIIEKNPLILWCRINECFYLDKNGIAFAKEADIDNPDHDKKLIKITEEREIEEEKKEENLINPSEKIKDTNNKDDKLFSNETNDIDKIEIADSEKISMDTDTSFSSIAINDDVTDKDFLEFVLIINSNINNFINFQVKYYKTKGTRTRELIAYTDKNIRIYFDSTEDPIVQLSYLKDFLSGGINSEQLNSLSYIYVKSGNKIFYK